MRDTRFDANVHVGVLGAGGAADYNIDALAWAPFLVILTLMDLTWQNCRGSGLWWVSFLFLCCVVCSALACKVPSVLLILGRSLAWLVLLICLATLLENYLVGDKLLVYNRGVRVLLSGAVSSAPPNVVIVELVLLL